MTTMNNRMGPLIAMTLATALLAGFGYSQFAGVAMAGGEGSEHEHESDGEHEHNEGYGMPLTPSPEGGVLHQVVARYGGHVTEVEKEYADGRSVLEIELVDGEGHRRELLVDADTVALLREKD
jgi:uncharacterized membrane protein YkoI